MSSATTSLLKFAAGATAQRIVRSSFADVPDSCEQRPEISERTDQDCELSIMIPVYNPPDLENFVALLESISRQVRDMSFVTQICVLDDGSRDNLSSLVNEACPAATYIRRDLGLGLVGNFNSCIEESVGRLIHIPHQDDVIGDGFYQAVLQPFQEDRSFVGQSFCRIRYIDGDDQTIADSKLQRASPGILSSWWDNLLKEQQIQFVSSVVSRECFEAIGGFRSDLSFAMDWEMWLCVARNFPVWYSPQIQAEYRVHSASATASIDIASRWEEELLIIKSEGLNRQSSHQLVGAVQNRALDYWRRCHEIFERGDIDLALSFAAKLAGSRTIAYNVFKALRFA